MERLQQQIKGYKPVWHKGIISSLKQDWTTPQEVFDGLKEIGYNIDFDPCPSNPTFDGLDPNTKWGKFNFVNPPYGRYKDGKYKGKSGQDLFIHRAWMERFNGNTSILLIPVRTSSKRWKRFILDQKGVDIHFCDKRFRFSSHGDPSIFDSALIKFNPIEVRLTENKRTGEKK